ALADATHLSRQMAAWQIGEPAQRIAESVLTELRLQSGAGVHRASGTVWWTRGRVWAYGLAGAFAAVLLVASIATSPLRRSRQAVNIKAGLTNTPTVPSAAKVRGQQGQQVSAEVPAGPMVIRTVRLTLVTKEFDVARS